MLRNRLPLHHFMKLVTLVSLLFVGVLTSSVSRGQGLSVSAGEYNECEGECCLRFDFVIPAGVTVKTLGVQLITLTSAQDDCFDWDCLATQISNLNPAGSFSHTGTGTFAITWGGNGVTGPASFTFYLCDFPNHIGPSCASGFPMFSYNAVDNSSPQVIVMSGSNIPIDGPCGAGNDVNCSGCDKFWVDFNYRCATKFCFRRAGTVLSSPTCSLRITFNPPISNCITSGQAPGCSAGTANGILPMGGGWTVSAHNATFPPNTIDYIDFFSQSQPNCIGHCHTFCFTIPKCYGPGNYTVNFYDLNDPTSGCGATSYALKHAPDGSVTVEPSGYGSQGLQNYPNPLVKDNGYKTIIPFTLNGAAEARITIYDPAGSKVHTETAQFTGSGKHSFQFTAEQLPTGTYYYAIESPLGAVIVQRTMLVVK